MNLSDSRTLENLMRAYAGECQARARYDFAAGAARNAKLPCIQYVFDYTAGQEYQHASVFWKQLRAAGMTNVNLASGYPVDLKTDALSLLRDAQHNEDEEHRVIYPDYAEIAREEGFEEIAFLFARIATIEETHSQRFELLANWLESGRLFSSGGEKLRWVCLNCGNVVEAAAAPEICPVCRHEQGYYIRADYAPYARG